MDKSLNIIIIGWIHCLVGIIGISTAYGEVGRNIENQLAQRDEKARQCFDMSFEGINVRTKSSCVEVLGIYPKDFGKELLSDPDIEENTPPLRIELDLVKDEEGKTSSPETKLFKVVNYTFEFEDINDKQEKRNYALQESELFNKVLLIPQWVDIGYLGALEVETILEDGATEKDVMDIVGTLEIDKIRKNEQGETAYVIGGGNSIVTIGDLKWEIDNPPKGNLTLSSDQQEGKLIAESSAADKP